MAAAAAAAGMAEGEQTLWDRDELTVRFIMEEGKLNLVARELADVRERTSSSPALEASLAAAAKRTGMEPNVLLQRVAQYERSLGSLLECCLQSVEAVQTADLPLVVGMACAATSELAQAPDGGAAALAGKSEALGAHFLKLVFRRADQLGDATVAGLAQDHGAVPALSKALLRADAIGLPKEWREAALEVLTGLCANDLWQAREEELLGGEAGGEAFRGLGRLLKDVASKPYEQRKHLQPLIDAVGRANKSAGAAGLNSPPGAKTYSGSALAARLAAIAGGAAGGK